MFIVTIIQENCSTKKKWLSKSVIIKLNADSLTFSVGWFKFYRHQVYSRISGGLLSLTVSRSNFSRINHKRRLLNLAIRLRHLHQFLLFHFFVSSIHLKGVPRFSWHQTNKRQSKTKLFQKSDSQTGGFDTHLLRVLQ